jgi:hypothetical protein
MISYEQRSKGYIDPYRCKECYLLGEKGTSCRMLASHGRVTLSGFALATTFTFDRCTSCSSYCTDGRMHLRSCEGPMEFSTMSVSEWMEEHDKLEKIDDGNCGQDRPLSLFLTNE